VAVCGREREMDAADDAGLPGESLRLVFLEVARVSVVWRRKSERAARDAAAAAGGGQRQAGGGGKRAAALTFCFSLSLYLLRPGDLGSLRVAHPAASALFSSLCAQTITRHFIKMLFFLASQPRVEREKERNACAARLLSLFIKIDPGGISALVISQLPRAHRALVVVPAFFGLSERKRMCIDIAIHISGKRVSLCAVLSHAVRSSRVSPRLKSFSLFVCHL
jgi:hypothetical protein